MVTRLSTKGQLSIPKTVRDRHGWEAGTELEIEDRGDCVVLRPVLEVPRTELEDLVGCTGYRGPRRSLGEMEEGIAKGARESR
jgi:AbrB family looped-hinge helix DNA binding protein